jgi:hypothetical protein
LFFLASLFDLAGSTYTYAPASLNDSHGNACLTTLTMGATANKTVTNKAAGYALDSLKAWHLDGGNNARF